MVSNIVLYGSKSCPWTERIKHILEEKDIPKFKFIDVIKDLKARSEMIINTKQYSIPVVEINGKFIIGYDHKELEKALV
jgi:glutaredoxin 3